MPRCVLPMSKTFTQRPRNALTSLSARACSLETTMKPPPKRLSDLKPAAGKTQTYAPPTPKVARRKPGKTLTAAERAAFLAARPDLKPKG